MHLLSWTTMFRHTLFLVSLLILTACGVKMDLPTATNSEEPSFGSGDTSYIRISPDWGGSHGYNMSKPGDVIIGADGYVFIADGILPSIHVISAAGVGTEIDDYGNDFSDLNGLSSPDGLPYYPKVIDQDTRLNLFVADSSNRLLVWNQYLDNVGVDSIAIGAQLQSPLNELLWVADSDSIEQLQNEGWEVAQIWWSHEGVEYWESPRLFWDASDSLEALQVSKFFINPNAIKVTGISSQGDMVYVADANANAILGLTYVPAALLMTGAGDHILAYVGSVTERTVSSGTGNGTVNDPRGMTHGNDGALYYTQWGENFSVHKVGGTSGFEYGEDDIMNIERYAMASDVALDPLHNIYIADTGNDRIQQFNSTGRFTYNIGMSKVVIDSTIYDSVFVDTELEVTSRDTSFQIEVADILRSPRGVAVDGSGVVYIADTGNDRIMRYRLSTELDYSTEN